MKPYEDNFYTQTVNEDLFTTLVKKESWIKDIFLNAVYLKNSFWGVHWSYYIYFYDKNTNICYINDLNFYGSVERLSVTNTIEQLSTNILPYIKHIQQKNISLTEFKLPSFIYFYNRWYGNNEVVKQMVSLKPLYDEDKDLYGFYKPNWSVWSVILKPTQDDKQDDKVEL